MRYLQQITRAAMAATAIAAVTGGQLAAGEPGIVRISDSVGRGTSFQSQTIQASARYIGHNNAATASYGQCGPGGCSSCGGSCGECGGQGHGCCFGGCCQGCKSADHGWGRPIKRPINRLPVQYQRYWPNAFYGQAGAGYTGANVNYYPMVYMPTDTTQLGYYYQQVPFWRPVPDMVPPVPWPSQWHLREGQNPNGDVISNGNCGTNADGNEAAPNLQPVPDSGDTQEAPTEEPPPVPKTARQTAQQLIP